MDGSFRHRVLRSKKLTPEERFYDTLEMIDLSQELMRAGVRMQFPEADDQQVHEIMRKRRRIIDAQERRR
jgi:hypothetical protein